MSPVSITRDRGSLWESGQYGPSDQSLSARPPLSGRKEEYQRSTTYAVKANPCAFAPFVNWIFRLGYVISDSAPEAQTRVLLSAKTPKALFEVSRRRIPCAHGWLKALHCHCCRCYQAQSDEIFCKCSTILCSVSFLHILVPRQDLNRALRLCPKLCTYLQKGIHPSALSSQVCLAEAREPLTDAEALLN